MRSLIPRAAEAAEVDLAAHYAEGWLDRGGLRANMVASADGAADADGVSAGLQTPGDNVVFAMLRALADVVLVGWSTAATEKYGPARPDAAVRARWGLRPDLPVAVISRSLQVDPAGRLFENGNRPLVVTCARSDARRRADLSVHADVLVCGNDDIDYGAVRVALAERGLTRVLCEGGPTILARIIAAGELDELCLSLSPSLTGPGAGRIVAGHPWTGAPRPLHLRDLLEEDGALFLRYSARQPGAR